MKFLIYGFASVLFLTSVPVRAVDNCEPILSGQSNMRRDQQILNLWGRATTIEMVSGISGRVKINDIIQDLDPDDLVVGVESGHVTIMYGDGRYDGTVIDPMAALVMGNAKIRHRNFQSVDQGVLIRLSGLSLEAQKKLREFFHTERREFSLTCATGACSVISRAGVRNLAGILPPLTANQFLKRLITAEIKNRDQSSIRKEIFFVSDPCALFAKLYFPVIG